MKADDLVAPYLQKRCGEEADYEGPDFIFKLQHTPLNEFLNLVSSETWMEERGEKQMEGRQREVSI
jgi:hypothetical protein